MQHNSLTNNHLPITSYHLPIYERFRTKVYVRNFKQIMQNEPKLQKPQMNVNNLLTRNYENRTLGERGKNEPKRTQNEPKVKIGKIEPNALFKKGLYQFLPLRTYKNEPKRTQNKPNFPRRHREVDIRQKYGAAYLINLWVLGSMPNTFAIVRPHIFSRIFSGTLFASSIF